MGEETLSGHGHNDVQHRLHRIESSVGRIEQSVGLAQAALERIEGKVNVMPTNQDLLDAVDAIDANFQQDLSAEKAQIIAAIAAAAQAPLDTIAAMQATIDDLKAQLAAGSDTAPAIARLQALRDKTEQGIKDLVPDAVPVPDPNAPPDTGGGSPPAARRR
jgi:hypothetical protein